MLDHLLRSPCSVPFTRPLNVYANEFSPPCAQLENAAWESPAPTTALTFHPSSFVGIGVNARRTDLLLHVGGGLDLAGSAGGHQQRHSKHEIPHGFLNLLNLNERDLHMTAEMVPRSVVWTAGKTVLDGTKPVRGSQHVLPSSRADPDVTRRRSAD